MSSVAVSVKGLGKAYRVYSDSASRVVEALSFGRAKRHKEKWALRDVNFELERGTALGVVGANGAGKSTLLKILTGTMRPTTGSYAINGTLGSLLELGAGFHSDFTGRDNVFMNAAILGIPRAEVKRRYDELADFAELGDYLDRPVRTYSSGMQMRLGFAVAMMAKPEVMILDEVLAVGDAHFQKKCMDRIREIRLSGATVLFVSHSVYHVRQICDRAIWIHDGQVVMDGTPIRITDEYSSYQHSLAGGAARAAAAGGASGGKEALPHLTTCEIRKVGDASPRGEGPVPLDHGDEVEMRFGFANPAGNLKTHFGVLVLRNDDVLCFGVRSVEQLPAMTGTGGTASFRFKNDMLAGDYYVSGFLLDESCEHVLDQRIAWGKFTVRYGGMERGVYLPRVAWRGPEPGL